MMLETQLRFLSSHLFVLLPAAAAVRLWTVLVRCGACLFLHFRMFLNGAEPPLEED